MPLTCTPRQARSPTCSVGGTGAYQHAGGQITVERTLPDGTTDVETLRLILFETG